MNRIKKLRIQKGLTQQQLANLLFVNQQNITGYERGDSEPSIDALIRMADIFDTSIDYLVGYKNSLNKQDGYEKVVIEWFRSLPSEIRESFVNILEYYHTD